MQYRPKVRSRHPSHDVLRNALPYNDFPSIVRLGSLTTVNEAFSVILNKLHRKGKTLPPIVEINTIDAIKISSNKLLMKEKFRDAQIKTAQWFKHCDNGGNGKNNMCNMSTNGDYDEGGYVSFKDLPYPIVAKHIFGSRGTGNHLLKNADELTKWIEGKDLSKYIFEKYYAYNREYRLHVCQDGCFYTCRKMLKSYTPEDKRWFRNDSNSVWMLETNPFFDKPVNWDKIVIDCLKALNSVGLDFAAFDVKVQSSKRKNKEGKEVIIEAPDYIIIESNSAPSFGTETAKKYMEILPKLIIDKHENLIK